MQFLISFLIDITLQPVKYNGIQEIDYKSSKYFHYKDHIII